MFAVGVPVALSLLLMFWAVGAYKRLVRLRKRLRRAFGQVEEPLKRRYALVPGLVDSVKHVLAPGSETVDAVIDAHNAAVAANVQAAADSTDGVALRDLGDAESSLTACLARMISLAEKFGDPNADARFAQLMGDLAEIEARIAFSRQTYNEGVMEYNGSLRQFPSSVIANLFSFAQAPVLHAADPLQPGAGTG